MYGIKNILKTTTNFEKIEFNRFNSWNHCYQYFQNDYFKNNGDDNYAALHLSFYLSSWGMYRGSSFLLQNDFKIHIEIVKKLKKYYQINSYSYKEINSLKNEITSYYQKFANKSKKNSNTPSDTLISKILLGTLCCTPAYDRFFIDGIKIFNMNNTNLKIDKTFSEKSLKQLNEFYLKNYSEFKAFEDKYPRMKLIDMYFWELGFNKNTFLQYTKP